MQCPALKSTQTDAAFCETQHYSCVDQYVAGLGFKEVVTHPQCGLHGVPGGPDGWYGWYGWYG